MSTALVHRHSPLAAIRTRIIRSGVAVATAGFAAVINAVLWPDFGLRYPLIMFYPAITVSAWYGGLLPGMLCTALSGLVAAIVWLDPRFSPRISPGADAVALMVFVAVGLVISALSESLKARTRLERTARHVAEAAEARLAIELADTQRLYELNTALLKAGELPQMLQAVLQACIELLRADGGDVRLYDEADDALRIIAQRGLLDESTDASGRVRRGDSLCAETPVRRERLIVEDARREPVPSRLAAWCAAYGFAAVQSSPILTGEGVFLGLLTTYRREPYRPTDRELRFLDLYVRQAGHAIERSRLLESERAAREEAEQANRLKDHFLSTVSHELRTPLNAVLGWADMLRSGRLVDERRDRALQAIYDNAHRQAQLIDDLLDISRIMSGTLRLERAAVDLRSVVHAAVDVIEPAARAKAISLVVDCDADVATSCGDPLRLQQVVWNLLSNAVKFTPEGGAVHLLLRKTSDAVDIVVRDTGPGIPRDFLPVVFEPFRQADTSTTRRQGGLGLGLSIVKHLVEAHDGTVHAANGGSGQGAVFTVRLPIVAVNGDLSVGGPSPIRAVSDVSGTAVLQGVVVLVVEDNADSRDVIAASLGAAGATVGIAGSAAEALDHLAHNRADVLVADIAMPRENGYTLMRKVRALGSPNVAGIPAVALTSMARDEDRRRALDAGYQLHLAKPIDARSLARAVAGLVRGGKQ